MTGDRRQSLPDITVEEHEETVLRRLAEASKALDPDDAERGRLLDEVGRRVQEFLAGVRQEPTYRRPSSSTALGRIPASPRSAEAVLAALREHVDHSGVALTSPRNFGYLPTGGLFHAGLAALLASVTNRYSGLDTVSPGAVALESAMLRWIAEEMGLPDGTRGVFTSGASLATAIAVATARDAAQITGRADRAVVYLTSQTHHCLDKALRLCGLDGVARRRVAVDDRWRMRPEALRAQVRHDLGAGLHPWLVVATAGTVSSGAVDPLVPIADAAIDHGLWLHIDGAYGGLYALCNEGRGELSGLERADSLVVDPHKTLFLPYGIGAVLIRDGRHLAAGFAGDAAYLDRQVSAHTVPESPADLSPELTRPFRALSLWLPMQLIGTDAFRAALSEKLRLARWAHRCLDRSGLFEMAQPPQLGVVTLRIASPAQSPAEVDRLNATLAETVRRRGQIFLTTTRLDDRLYLRLAVGSFRTHLDDVREAVTELVEQTDLLLTASPPPAPTRPTFLRHPRGAGMTDDHLDVIVDVDGDDLDATRLCELDVLSHRYGDTAEDLERAYGDYADTTVFIGLRHPRHGIIGFTRLIAPGPLTQKTLADIGTEPWSVDGQQAARSAGLDPATTWDVATIGVRPGLPLPNGLAAGVLYSAIMAVPLANGGRSIVSIIDRRVRDLLRASGLILHDLPGTGPRPYMGSPACAPTYADLETLPREQLERAPAAYRRFWLGEGLEGLVRWRPGGRVRSVPIAAMTAVADVTDTRPNDTEDGSVICSDTHLVRTPTGYPLSEVGGGHGPGEVIALQDIEAQIR